MLPVLNHIVKRRHAGTVRSWRCRKLQDFLDKRQDKNELCLSSVVLLFDPLDLGPLVLLADGMVDVADRTSVRMSREAGLKTQIL